MFDIACTGSISGFDALDTACTSSTSGFDTADTACTSSTIGLDALEHCLYFNVFRDPVLLIIPSTRSISAVRTASTYNTDTRSISGFYYCEVQQYSGVFYSNAAILLGPTLRILLSTSTLDVCIILLWILLVLEVMYCPGCQSTGTSHRDSGIDSRVPVVLKCSSLKSKLKRLSDRESSRVGEADMTESSQVSKVLKAELTECSRAPRVPGPEKVEYSQVPRVRGAQMTEYSRVPRVPGAEMTGTR